MLPAGSLLALARLIVLATAAALWLLGRDRWPTTVILTAAVLTGFLGAMIAVDLARGLVRRRGMTGPDAARDLGDPPDLPVLIPDLAPLPTGASPALTSVADLHTHPLFYEKTPADIHPVFASRIARIDRIGHRYLYAYSTYTDGDAVGTGAAFNAREAMQASIYEAMERLFSTFYDPAALVRGSFRALGQACIDPRELVLPRDWEYDRAAFPYVRYHDDLDLDWVQGLEVSDSTLVPKLLPATLAVRGYSLRHRTERFAPSLSAGTASAGTYAEAVLRGFYELVERDAFAIAWLNRLSCPRITPVSVTVDPVAGSMRALAADGFDVTFVDLTTDLGIPVVLTAVRRSHSNAGGRVQDAGVTFGLGCHLNPALALTRSYVEALTMLLNFYDFSDPDIVTPRSRRAPGLSIDLDRYFVDCAFLTAGDAVRRADEIPQGSTFHLARDFERCVTRCAAHGVRLFFVDQTPAPLRGSARYCLVRVLASRLQPHLYETDLWRLSDPRLTAAPVAMGRLSAPRREEDLNLLPNPFAVYHRLV